MHSNAQVKENQKVGKNTEADGLQVMPTNMIRKMQANGMAVLQLTMKPCFIRMALQLLHFMYGIM